MEAGIHAGNTFNKAPGPYAHSIKDKLIAALSL